MGRVEKMFMGLVLPRKESLSGWVRWI